MSLIKLNGECFAAKNVQFLSLVKVNIENLALKDSSSFDSPRYDCVLFMSLIKLNGECFAAKNVQFLTFVKVNSNYQSEHFAVKIDILCFTLRFAEGCLIVCILFLSLIKVNSKHFAVKIDRLYFTLRFAEGCLIVGILFCHSSW